MISTIIIDNISNKRLKSEWGLSILIEENGKKVLLDFGASRKFMDNAEKLGIDLNDIDISVLSHAHYDHGNGIPFFLEFNKKAKVYMEEETKENCYTMINVRRRYEGLPKGTLKKYKDRIIYVNELTEITDGFYILPHIKPHLEIGIQEGMFLKEEKGYSIDNLMHEESLVVRTKEGLVVFSSCSHIGIDNIIKEVRSTFKNEKIYSVIGGFHLYNKTDEYVKDLGYRLKELDVKHIYTGHCTGMRAYNILKDVLGDRLNKIETGLIINI